jgi:hypothetical protein
MRPLTRPDRALLQQVRAYSPITAEQRREVEKLRAWISHQPRLGPKEMQRIADVYRAPVQTVGRAAIAGFVEYGLMLIDLQQRIPPGTWMALFRDTGPRALLRPIPLSVKQAQALMRIARHPVLSDPGVFESLPPHWRTLDELTRVPLAALNQGITRGAVHPAMQRENAVALREPLPQAPVHRPVGRPAARPTEADIEEALDRVVALATRAGLSAPAIARLLRARAEAVDEAPEPR